MKVVYQWVEGSAEQLCFINQRRPQCPWPYQQGMQGGHYPHYNPNQNAPFQPWYSFTHLSCPTPPPWIYTPYYAPHPIHPPCHPYPPQSFQWGNPSQGWRPQTTQPPTLLPPPQPQPKITHHTPPKQPKIPNQPNLNPNNKKAQQVYSGETSYPTYVVKIQEINLRSGEVLPIAT